MRNVSLNTWAVRCDGIAECTNGEDEAHCSIPDEILYVILPFGIVTTLITLFITMKKAMEKYQQLIVPGNYNNYMVQRM